MTSSGPRKSRIRRAARLSGRDWLDLLRGIICLGRARLIHRAMMPADLMRLTQEAGRGEGQDSALAERVARAIPRAASLVPWRSDCFVQALAGQAWLAAHGVGSRLFIGVRKDARGFTAHAWLRHGDVTVTGGDFSTYSPVLTPETLLSDPPVSGG